VKLFHDVRITMKLAAHVLAMFVCLLVLSASADPLAPPEAAALTNRLLDGKVWLVHAVVSASSTGLSGGQHGPRLAHLAP